MELSPEIRNPNEPKDAEIIASQEKLQNVEYLPYKNKLMVQSTPTVKFRETSDGSLFGVPDIIEVDSKDIRQMFIVKLRSSISKMTENYLETKGFLDEEIAKLQLYKKGCADKESKEYAQISNPKLSCSDDMLFGLDDRLEHLRNLFVEERDKIRIGLGNCLKVSGLEESVKSEMAEYGAVRANEIRQESPGNGTPTSTPK